MVKMKNNREFLDGIYDKAKVLQYETNKRKAINKRYYRLASIAALIILIPMFVFVNNNLGYKEIHEKTRMISLSDPNSYFYEADFIVIGEVNEIKQSIYKEEENYIYTDIVITLDQALRGDIKEEQIVLRINGGKVKKEKVYSKMESEFSKGKRYLLFMIKGDGEIYHLVQGESQFIEKRKDVFEDKLGNKYSLEDIENKIKMEED